MSEITKQDLVKASGYFLSIYHTDMVYISRFKEWKEGRISNGSYHKEFYNFLKKYGVIRTINGKESVEPLLKKTKEWIDKTNNLSDVEKNDVDEFTKTLKEPDITEKHIVSLASKALFLNNPYQVFPMDSRAKRAINYAIGNNYKKYLDNLESFVADYNIDNKIKDCLEQISPLVEIVEQDFKNKLEQIETIRNNRFKDTLLWTLGEKKNQ